MVLAEGDDLHRLVSQIPESLALVWTEDPAEHF